MELFESASAFLESFLKDNDFIVGDSLTVADLILIPLLSAIDAITPIDADKFPRLSSYLDRQSKLPYYAEINVPGNKALKGMLDFCLKRNKSEQ